MLVRVIYDNGSESLYECSEYHVIPNDEQPENLFFQFDPNGRLLEIKKEKMQIYVMNNQGKTIDSYIWD